MNMWSRGAARLGAAITASLACGLIVGVAPSAAALTSPEQLLLDSFQTPKAAAAGPVATTNTLTSGTFYGIEVSGTYSAYLPANWARTRNPFLVCGTPDASPALPSPGRTLAPAGQDAEWMLARPWKRPCPHTTPFAVSLLQADLGSGFAHPTPNGAPLTAPAANHTYVYLVQGQGNAARFRIVDSNTTDNNGVLQITVRPATVSDCAGNAACLAQVQPVTTVAPSAAASSTLPLPANRSCLSRRRFLIHIVTHRHDPIKTATVIVNGKRVKVTSRKVHGTKRLTAVIDLRKRPKSIYKVLITARTRGGKILVGRRTYHTCSIKHSGSTPPLRLKK